MAILLNGMNKREIVRWTEAMIASGSRMDFSDFEAPSVDKHSTGGVGDKVTLPLVPIVCCVRSGCSAVERSWPRLLRGHFGQDGIHSRMACPAVPTRRWRVSCAPRVV